MNSETAVMFGAGGGFDGQRVAVLLRPGSSSRPASDFKPSDEWNQRSPQAGSLQPDLQAKAGCKAVLRDGLEKTCRWICRGVTAQKMSKVH